MVERHTCRQVGRQADGQTGRRADGQTGRRADGQTGRRADGQTGRRADGQTGRRPDSKASQTYAEKEVEDTRVVETQGIFFRIASLQLLKLQTQLRGSFLHFTLISLSQCSSYTSFVNLDIVFIILF